MRILLFFFAIIFLSCNTNLKNEKFRVDRNRISNGVWVSSEDSLSKIKIKQDLWSFHYLNEKPTPDDHYKYVVKESIFNKDSSEIIAGRLVLSNSTDTLEYEIDYISKSKMTLIYSPRGNYLHYSKKN